MLFKRKIKCVVAKLINDKTRKEQYGGELFQIKYEILRKVGRLKWIHQLKY